MLFNSVEFLIFFPLVVILYFLVPLRLRIPLLVGASYYFYMSWRPEYIILIIVSTLIDYYVGRKIGKEIKGQTRKIYLFISLATNLGILFFFKYFIFFNDSIRSLLYLVNINYISTEFNLLLPVGISFYTFQTLSYTINVYRGVQKPEHNLIKFALYVSFFPQLVAGPIERSDRLLPQFDNKHSIDYYRITDGLKLMAWGFFKKLVIADRLAALVNHVYSDPTSFTGIPLLLATYFFAFQIYCDFSGYSDIAIGAARVMGYDLMENFRQPYFAKSIADFWRRWHISLSTWFRDYVYIPLGGNRFGDGRMFFNLLVVFVVSGLWHGASWTFVIWGAVHGLLIVGSILGAKLLKAVFPNRLPERKSAIVNGIKIFGTFHLVLLSWVFFRANTISDAFYIIRNVFTGFELKGGYGLNFGGSYEIMITTIALLVLLLVDFLREKGLPANFLGSRPVVIRWALYYVLLLSILLFGEFGITEFIYFQF
jgi:alginate O-acetyltransferase complex protein AlgI